jgi:hypothetical protein
MNVNESNRASNNPMRDSSEICWIVSLETKDDVTGIRALLLFLLLLLCGEGEVELELEFEGRSSRAYVAAAS